LVLSYFQEVESDGRVVRFALTFAAKTTMLRNTGLRYMQYCETWGDFAVVAKATCDML
jgi:hypothetical protein